MLRQSAVDYKVELTGRVGSLSTSLRNGYRLLCTQVQRIDMERASFPVWNSG